MSRERETGRLVIRGGRVLDPGTGMDAVRDVWIRDGRIERLAEPGSVPAKGASVVEAAGCYVMPGLIDLHVHLRDPGF